jgi:hypothetical protein
MRWQNHYLSAAEQCTIGFGRSRKKALSGQKRRAQEALSGGIQGRLALRQNARYGCAQC